MSASLQAHSISVRFGGLIAVDDVTMEVPAGGFVGLIGPNGAGKTTLFNVVSGFQPPSAGTLAFDEINITGMPASTRAALGIGRTFQKLELFGRMTAFENLMVAAEAGASRLGVTSDLLGLPKRRREEARCAAIAEDMLADMGLEEVRDRQAADLPVGFARKLELGRALCRSPRLLLLDEPSSGLDSEETRAFGELLTRINVEQNVTVLIVEHDMDLVMEVCRDIYVLDFGRLIAHGSPAQITSDPRVRAAYLGEEDHEAAAPLA
jgi:ABC-type branched-subunit amino acid transport system ATPase component